MSQASESWYREGLRFTCTQCGDCCTGAAGFVWVDADEIAALAERLAMGVPEFQALHTRWTPLGRSLRERANGDCVFYQQGVGCTVYALRPRQCRTWPFWQSNLRTASTWKKTCDDCPGAGQGQLVPAEEITRRLKVIPL